MAINYLILLSRQGKVRLAKWFTTLSPRDKAKIIKDVSQLVLSRRTRMCNFLEYKDTKVVYRRYASLFFIAGCSSTDNELITLEIVHRYVEQMDKYYGNVCELDIIFNFQKAYFILDELLLAGEMQESSKKNVLRCIGQQDSLEDMEPALIVPVVRPLLGARHTPGYRRVYSITEREHHTQRLYLVDLRDLAGVPSGVEIEDCRRTLAYRSIQATSIPTHERPCGKRDKMKFLPLQEFDDVTSALNFDTPDCHVIGGCDLYTTKAAGSDKKLYKSIEHSLESQYESLLRLSASLSVPQASSAASALNLSRSSPFGPLTQISSRRTFAYLIATLNASHPDYDFSHLLRPSDFRCERSLKSVMNTIDTTLSNLRPRPAASSLAVPNLSTMGMSGMPGPGGSRAWGPHMWRQINKEMSLRECSIYCYAPEEDPYDGEEGAIWSLNYFFFNKARKRVCYLYLRGLSVLSHSPVAQMETPRKPLAKEGTRSYSTGANKRATYWLGDRVNAGMVEGALDEDDDEEIICDMDDEVDLGEDILGGADEMETRFNGDGQAEEAHHQPKNLVRGVSEEIAESMEI